VEHPFFHVSVPPHLACNHQITLTPHCSGLATRAAEFDIVRHRRGRERRTAFFAPSRPAEPLPRRVFQPRPGPGEPSHRIRFASPPPGASQVRGRLPEANGWRRDRMTRVTPAVLASGLQASNPRNHCSLLSLLAVHNPRENVLLASLEGTTGAISVTGSP
jgi:hypothetical protein